MARTTRDIRAHLHPGGAVFDLHQPGAELLRIDQETRVADVADRSPGNEFLSVMAVAEINNFAAPYARRGYWNDPDMMVTGDPALSEEQQKAHFALWCVMSAPLFLGNDPRHLSAAEKEIILNRECIAVNQDPSEQGRRIAVDGQCEIWRKRLRDGGVALVLLNRGTTARQGFVILPEWLDLPGAAALRDLYAQVELGTWSIDLPAQGCRFVLARPAAGR
jgi:alpha-galactosidase